MNYGMVDISKSYRLNERSYESLREASMRGALAKAGILGGDD